MLDRTALRFIAAFVSIIALSFIFAGVVRFIEI